MNVANQRGYLFLFANRCTLHQVPIHVGLGIAPIPLLTVLSIILIFKKNPKASSSNVDGVLGTYQSCPWKHLATVLCLLCMGVTWSLSLSCLILNEEFLVILFAVLNIFQGPLVLPFLVSVSLAIKNKGQSLDIPLDETWTEQQQVVKVRNKKFELPYIQT